jgi:hypothetical protein
MRVESSGPRIASMTEGSSLLEGAVGASVEGEECAAAHSKRSFARLSMLVKMWMGDQSPKSENLRRRHRNFQRLLYKNRKNFVRNNSTIGINLCLKQYYPCQNSIN